MPHEDKCQADKRVHVTNFLERKQPGAERHNNRADPVKAIGVAVIPRFGLGYDTPPATHCQLPPHYCKQAAGEGPCLITVSPSRKSPSWRPGIVVVWSVNCHFMPSHV